MSDERVIFVNDASTLMVELWANPAIVEIIEGEITEVNVIRRPAMDHVWGPPVPCKLQPSRFIH